MNYLDNGGNLYIESVNIGIDYSTTTFFDFFGIKYNNDGSEEEATFLFAGDNDLTDGLHFIYSGGPDPHYSLDQLGTDGGELLFESDDGHGRMFLMEEVGHKVISSSILLGAIASGDSLNLKPYLVSEIVNYFLDYDPTTSLKENMADLFSMCNYPNPFNSETRIDYKVQEKGRVSINVYNINGQLVKQLVDKEMLPGNYSVIWDASNQNGEKTESGFYFYKIILGNNSQTEKMILY
jgi:hypothetical protein